MNSSFRVYIRNKQQSTFYHLIFLLILSVKCKDMFRDIKKLSLYDNYFVVLSSGLYLYDFNFLNCSMIYKFDNSFYKDTSTSIIITEIKGEGNSFILCLVDKYLFIFNPKNNETNTYILNDVDIVNSQYHNLLSYNIINNFLRFIIVSYKNPKLYFYYYNLHIKNNIIKVNEKSFNIGSINKLQLNCQINFYLSYINCFYCLKSNLKLLLSTKFVIEDINIIMEQTNNYTLADSANVIRSASSINNKFFVCISSGTNKTMICYINDFTLNNFEKLNCKFGKGFNENYKIFILMNQEIL